MREELRKTWLAEQERIKNEVIEITYSYWDGSGHRKVVECKKGDDIGAFLSKCRAQVPELRGTSVDNMMYIKVRLGTTAQLTRRRISSSRTTTRFTTSSSTRLAASRVRSSTLMSTMTCA